MVTELASEEFNPCTATIFKLAIKELRKRNKQEKNDLLEQFNNMEPLKKREYPREKIQKLINISRELKNSFENNTKTIKEITNKILEIINKDAHIYVHAIITIRADKLKKIGSRPAGKIFGR